MLVRRGNLPAVACGRDWYWTKEAQRGKLGEMRVHPGERLSDVLGDQELFVEDWSDERGPECSCEFRILEQRC